MIMKIMMSLSSRMMKSCKSAFNKGGLAHLHRISISSSSGSKGRLVAHINGPASPGTRGGGRGHSAGLAGPRAAGRAAADR